MNPYLRRVIQVNKHNHKGEVITSMVIYYMELYCIASWYSIHQIASRTRMALAAKVFGGSASNFSSIALSENNQPITRL